MRVLITLHPLLGHLHPLVPLAESLREAGHEVCFATAASFGHHILRAGFSHLAAGIDHPGDRLLFATLKEQGYMAADDPPGPYIFSDIMAPVMVRDLLAALGGRPPDLLVHDPVELGGCLAAEVWGIPHAAFSWAYHWPDETRAAWWGSGWAKLRRGHGLPPDPWVEALYARLAIDYMPPLWATPDFPRPPSAVAVRAPLYDRMNENPLPHWIHNLPDRPTVYATLGTSLNQNLPVFQAIGHALSGLPVNGIITLGPGVPARALEGFAPNVHVAEYLPQSLLLPECRLVVAHGGYNTLIAALHHGLPLVLIPLTAKDQPVNAARAQSLGLGRVVPANPVDVDALREAIGEVLENPGYGEQARSIQAAIHALPPLSEAVHRLENLVAGARPSAVNPGT